MLARALQRFASPQIRASTAVGSIVDAMDVAQALRALSCRLELARNEPPAAADGGGSSLSEARCTRWSSRSGTAASSPGGTSSSR